MKSAAVRAILVSLLACLATVGAMAQADKTYTLTGTVVEVDANTLVVKMDTGDVRLFTPPADRRFLIDGRELTLSQLQPGTKLTASVKESTSTVTDRTVETLEGTVFYAAGTTVILTLPTNERRQYSIKSGDPVKFYDYSNKEMTVFDLRKNMRIKATKITESPRTELVTTASVTGTAPTAAAQTQTAAAAAQAPAAAPAAPRAASSTPPPQPAETAPQAALPKTASPSALVGLIGLASLLTGVGLTAWRRRGSC
jgi:hypothetical protein